MMNNYKKSTGLSNTYQFDKDLTNGLGTGLESSSNGLTTGGIESVKNSKINNILHDFEKTKNFN
jgi:hypothetical protein